MIDVYFNIWFVIKIIALIISIFIFFYFLIKGKKTNLLYSYLFFHIIIFLGLTYDALQDLLYFLGIYNTFIVWLIQFGIDGFVRTYIFLSFLILSLYYTKSKINYKKIILLFLPLSVFYIIYLVTNSMVLKENISGYRILTSSQRLLIQYLNNLVCMIYMIFGLGKLLLFVKKQNGLYKKQSIILFFLMLSLLSINFIYNIIPLFNFNFYYFEFISLLYSFFTYAIAYMIFKYQFLDFSPLAFKNIVSNLQEAIIIIDNYNNIINYNKSFKLYFSNLIEKNQDFNDFLNRLKKDSLDIDFIEGIKSSDPKTELKGEINLISKELNFMVIIQPIFKKKVLLGKTMSFNNVTDYKRIIEEVTNAKAKNKITRDLHDSYGQTMTSIVTLLNVAKITSENNSKETKEKISLALDITKNGLNDIRKSLLEFKETNEINNNFMDLKKLFSYYEKLGLKIEANISDVDYVSGKYFSIIYKIITEALTNSISHGKSDKINITIKNSDKKYSLIIIDNGKGCEKIVKGLGLAGMEERVKEVNGNIMFGSEISNGFNIYVELPVEVNK